MFPSKHQHNSQYIDNDYNNMIIWDVKDSEIVLYL